MPTVLSCAGVVFRLARQTAGKQYVLLLFPKVAGVLWREGRTFFKICPQMYGVSRSKRSVVFGRKF